MFRFAILLSLSFASLAQAGTASVDIDTAAGLYQDAAIRQQVRASLGTMPAHVRKLFEGNSAAPMSEDQLDLVTLAATHSFRIDVFEVSALSAFAANLDAETVKKADAFFTTDYGKRMVAADVTLASLSDAEADKILNGDVTVPSNAQRAALFDKLERAERSAESTVQVLLTMGTAVALGTAIGSGMDPGPVEQRARKSGDAERQALVENMREPLRRYMAYGYRDLSDADLKHILAFLQTPAGKQYTTAYLASLGAGFYAMGRKCGEQLGESLREMAMAQLATENPDRAPDPDLKKRD